MPRSRTAVAVALTTVAAAAIAPAARAADPAPERILVRTEGKTSTLFEGPIVSRGHDVRASSDTVDRRCDATNAGASPTPRPTPTAATVDGQTIAGGTFDAQWYDGFDDYFVTRFGPDAQDDGAFAYWGVLVNGVLTPVGGCQYPMNANDSALWVYDAFNGRPYLRLDGPTGVGEPTAASSGGTPSGPVRQVFSVGLHAPLTVHVHSDDNETEGGDSSYGPVAGIGVSPVTTAANGAETVDRDSPATVTSGADGTARISWSTPGWKRIKADAAGYVRSNRLDVCVRDAAGNDCGPLPSDVRIRGAYGTAFDVTDATLGTTPVRGSGAVRTFSLANFDAVPRTVGAVSVTGGDASAFRVDASACTSAPVPAKGTCAVTVRFAPDAEGEQATTLTATVPGGDAPPSVALRGTGGPAVPVAPGPVAPTPAPVVPPASAPADAPSPSAASAPMAAPSANDPTPLGATSRAASRTDRRGRVVVRVRCPRSAGAPGCVTRVTLTARFRSSASAKVRTRTVASRTIRLAAGKRRTLRLRPSSAARSVLRRRVLSVRVASTTSVAQIVAPVRRTTVRLRARG